MQTSSRPSTDQHFRKARLRRAIVITAATALLAPVGYSQHADPAGAVTSRPRGTDFNGDGYDELVIADRNYDSGAANAGAVWVLPGSATGPRPSAASGWSQSRAGMPGDPGIDDRFGESWTSGDFDNDDFDDLAICVPGERVAGIGGAGAVSIIFGSPTGLRAMNSKLLSRATPGIPDAPTTNENWCNTGLIAGDFNRDGRDDLAVPSPFAKVSGMADAGSVTALLSTASGPSGVGAVEINQASPGVPGSPEISALLGAYGQGTGDFNGDGFDDLAVSGAFLTIDGHLGAGGVYTFFGSANGLRGAGAQLITQSTPGIPGTPASGGQFGYGFPAVADWDHDGYDDIVIADMSATVGAATNAGRIMLLRGSPSGLVGAGGKTIHQNSPGVPGSAENGDFFGRAALTSGDFDGNGRPDLAAGAQREDVDGAIDAGAFHTFPGTSASIGTTGSRAFTQDTPGVPGTAITNSNLSYGHVWVGNFNGDRYDDLVVPCSNCDIGPLLDSGYILVFRGSANGITTSELRQIKRSSLPGRVNETASYFGFAY